MPVNRTWYEVRHTLCGMADKLLTAQEILWKNVQAIMRYHFHEENLNRFANETKIGMGTISRIKAKEKDVRVGTLTKIAKRFGLQPWQLLMPGLDPAQPPVIEHKQVMTIRVTEEA